MALLEEIEPPSQNYASEKTKNVKFVYAKIKNHFDKFAKQFLTRKFLGNVMLFLKPNFQIFRNFIFNTKYFPHITLLVLGIFVTISNVSGKISSEAFYKGFIAAGPDIEYNVAENADKYTPLISEDALAVRKVIIASTTTADGFIANSGAVSTNITSREEPLPDNSEKEVEYLIRSGDTLTALGWKFDVKLATLKYVNDINDVNLIRPGLKIKVPKRGYEVPESLIAKRENEKRRKLAISQRNTVIRSSSILPRAYGADNSGLGLRVPIASNGISQGFRGRAHTGIDYRANVGTPVYAAASGQIVQITSGWSGGYGNQIVVSHGNGVLTRYAHLSRFGTSVGQYVNAGQVIGYSGNSGRSTGPHLHFEKIVNGVPVSPF